MWARSARLVGALRCVTGGWTRGLGAVHGAQASACVLPRVCSYSTGPWEHYTAGAHSDWEEGTRAEDVPEFNIKVLVNLLQQENGKDLCVIQIPPEMKYVEYFVIVGGTSTRHLQAMAQYTLKVYKFLKKDVKSHVCIEGKETDDWMCIDFGNIVVHFMLPETREAYELEKLWTLRSHDDQLSHLVLETLPSDFTFGLQKTD